MHRIRLILLVMLATALTGACATRPVAQPASDAREALNHGYAQLHWIAAKMRHVDQLLWVKQESDAVEAAVKTVSRTMGEHADALETFERERDDLRLDDDGLPRYEQRKRLSVIKQRGLTTGTPFLGQTGAAFERTLLLSLNAVINQQRHLMRVMRHDETAPVLRDWLKASEQALDADYEHLAGLLNSEYFCSD